MSPYYFFLGNTPDLSLLELQNIFPGGFSHLQTEIVSYEGECDLSKCQLLGGTRKIAQQLAVVTPQDLQPELTRLVAAESGKNVAVTRYAPEEMVRLSLRQLKDKVAETRPIRLVSMDMNEHELVMLSHQHVAEFNLLRLADNIAIAKTIWIYDAESWITRDRKKPYRDIKRGMLPPKLARIMVNLGTRGATDLLVADPFCGTGTVLTEALLTGNRALGCDNDPQAIEGAVKNTNWTVEFYQLAPSNPRVFVGDATHFDDQVSAVDVIVTEPYMGPLLDERNPSSLDRLKNVAKGLDKLYRGAFKSWASTLKSGSRVVISIPIFHVYNRTIETISIDTLRSLGYNYISSVSYGKPGAAVVRNITILEKN